MAQCRDMDFRFRRSFRLAPHLGFGLARSAMGASLVEAHGLLPPRVARGGLSYSEQSPWQRPKPAAQASAPGIEVAELPRVEIDVPPVAEAKPVPHDASKPDVDDLTQADPRLLKIALAIVALIAVAALLWAVLV